MPVTTTACSVPRGAYGDSISRVSGQRHGWVSTPCRIFRTRTLSCILLELPRQWQVIKLTTSRYISWYIVRSCSTSLAGYRSQYTVLTTRHRVTVAWYAAFIISVTAALRDRRDETTPVILAELKQMIDKWHDVHNSDLSKKQRSAIIKPSMFLTGKNLASGALESWRDPAGQRTCPHIVRVSNSSNIRCGELKSLQ